MPISYPIEINQYLSFGKALGYIIYCFLHLIGAIWR